MTENRSLSENGEGSRPETILAANRRQFLAGFGVGGIAAVAGCTGSGGTSDDNPDQNETETENGNGNSSNSTIEAQFSSLSWGGSQSIGDGEISTFTSEASSGEVQAVGLHFSEDTFTNLPYAEDFKNGDAEGQKVHGFWSKPFSLDFPDNVPAPIEFAGNGWNPQGHTPEGVYDRPHFDIHFYFADPKTISKIGPGTIESLPDEKVPEGYKLIEGGAIVPKMGAHLAPEDAPEFNGEEWLETLIWGAADIENNGSYELNFLEPMITLDFFQNHLDGVQKEDIAQPEVYPQAGNYPTTYAVYDFDDGGYAVVLEDFEQRE